MKKNTYDAASGALHLSPERTAAVAVVYDHYGNIFQARDNAVSETLREQYAFAKSRSLVDSDLHALNAFIFWTS